MNSLIEAKLETLMKENKYQKVPLNFDTVAIPTPKGDLPELASAS